MKDEKKDTTDLQRRSLLKNTAAATIGLGAMNAVSGAEAHAEEIIQPRAPIPEIVQQARPTARESVKITRLETFLVKPRWLFLKVHTNAGVVGLGEPITEGRALTCAAAIKEIEPYLVGKDPRAVVHHWQAIYRHAFYRGGPILTSALSGIDQALWDIKGKLLGVPVYELLGGPTRQRIRVYAHAGTPELIRERKAQGFTAFKTGPARLNGRYARPVENKAWIENAVAQIRRLARDRRQGRRHRHRFPRRDPASDGQDPDEGAGAVPAVLLRGDHQLPERRPDGRDGQDHAHSHRHRRTRSSRNGDSARFWRKARRRSCNPTSATRAASPKCG